MALVLPLHPGRADIQPLAEREEAVSLWQALWQTDTTEKGKQWTELALYFFVITIFLFLWQLGRTLHAGFNFLRPAELEV